VAVSEMLEVYISSGGMIMNDEVKRKWPWSVLTYPNLCLGVEKSYEKLQSRYHAFGRDSNLGTP
jgi:hypothetical protein